jgi:hypothetical protein
LIGHRQARGIEGGEEKAEEQGDPAKAQEENTGFLGPDEFIVRSYSVVDGRILFESARILIFFAVPARPKNLRKATAQYSGRRSIFPSSQSRGGTRRGIHPFARKSI